jgi:hypothetical protein
MHFLRKISIFISITLLLLACSGINRDDIAAPLNKNNAFYPVGFPDVRYFDGEQPESLDKEVEKFTQRLKSVRSEGDGLNILALSGGGPNGAFGAGVMRGWTQSGIRPEFDIVTGISTGAIIAPFAFLGSEYDDELEEFYTTTSTNDLVRARFLTGVLSGGSLYSTGPLKKVINRVVTTEFVDKLADEYERGRLLLVGTTNMDAEQPVIWNITEIASHRNEDARQLIRQVILASASIPILFTPVSFKVTDGTNEFSELHADGGLTQQIFTYNPNLPVKSFLRRAGLTNRANRIWIVHNAKINAVYQPQNTNLRKLGERTLETLIKSQGVGGLERIASNAGRDGFSIRAMIMPSKFLEKPTELFEPGYMSRLFAVGSEMGADPKNWSTRLDRLFRKDKAEGEAAVEAFIAQEEAIRVQATD